MVECEKGTLRRVSPKYVEVPWTLVRGAPLIILSVFYVLKVVYSGIKTGKVEIKEGIIYRRKKQPIAYWSVIAGQIVIVLALLCLISIVIIR